MTFAFPSRQELLHRSAGSRIHHLEHHHYGTES